MLTLDPMHEQIIGRRVLVLPEDVRQRAIHYIESRLQPLRLTDNGIVYRAVAAVMAQYSE